MGVAAGLLTGALAGHAELVFENVNLLVNGTTNSFTPQSFFHDSVNRMFGDELYLAGVSRQVTQFVIGYFGDFNAITADTLTLRLYQNDGEFWVDPKNPSVTARKPGSLLWQSSPTLLQGGQNRLIFSVPNVTVPNKLTWAVQFSGTTGVTGNDASLLVADPATVGAPLVGGLIIGSFNDFWIQNDPSKADSWALYQLQGGALKANFYASVTAVPEPSTWALAAVGGAWLGWTLRRRRS